MINPEQIINLLTNFIETSSPREIIMTILAAVALIRIIVTKIKKVRSEPKQPKRKKFKPKKWRPDGHYWDEEKKKWIAPDYNDTTPKSGS